MRSLTYFIRRHLGEEVASAAARAYYLKTSVTIGEVTFLAEEARVAGDEGLLSTCNAALSGDKGSIDKVVRIIFGRRRAKYGWDTEDKIRDAFRALTELAYAVRADTEPTLDSYMNRIDAAMKASKLWSEIWRAAGSDEIGGFAKVIDDACRRML